MNLSDYSDPEIVLYRAKFYFGEDVILKKSTIKTKKYMIYNPYNNKFIHFGQMGYKDFTKYVQIYDIKRALKIKSNWKDNPYSPNYLSLLLLWDF